MSEEAVSTLSSSTTVLGTVTALFDFTPSDPLGLGFKKGDVVTVYQCLESGWWEGSVEGTRGWFPSNFTTPLNTPEGEVKSDWVAQKGTNGKVYYYNKITGESTWEKPSEMEEIEEDKVEVNNDNLPKRESMLEIFEQKLPPGWSAHETDQGLIFYYHSETKTVQWTLPEEDSQDVEEEKSNEKDSQTNSLDNWGEKVLPDGRVYFYNMLTNETAWKKPDGSKQTMRKGSLATEKRTVSEELEIHAKFELPEKPGMNKSAWEKLAQGTIGSISDLNDAGKLNSKSSFVNLTKIIIKSIQMLFKVTTEDPTYLSKSKVLATHNKNIDDNLSKLVLSSKLASGVWPPPDAVARMQQVALEILMSVRLFITTAIDLGIPIENNFEMPERTFKAPPPPKARKPFSAHLPRLPNEPPPQTNSPQKTDEKTPPPQEQKESEVSSQIETKTETVVETKTETETITETPKVEETPVTQEPDNLEIKNITLNDQEKTQEVQESKQEIQEPNQQVQETPEKTPEVQDHKEDEEKNKEIVEKEEEKEEKEEKEEAPQTPTETTQPRSHPLAGSLSDSRMSVLDLSEVAHEQASVEEQQTDSYRIADLDICSKKVLKVVEELIANVKKSVQKSNHEERDALFAQPISKIVIFVGRIMSIADEIEDPENLDGYKLLKRNLYNQVSGLVQAARQAADPLAPSDALKQMMTSIQGLVNSIRQLVIGAKTLVAKKEQMENENLLNAFNQGSNITRTDSCQSLSDAQDHKDPREKGLLDDDDDDDDMLVVKRKSSNKVAKLLGEAPPETKGSNKLSKFFGENLKKAPTPKAQIPSYLLPDYNPKEMVFNMEGKVRGGTLSALVERLTQHDIIDTDFFNTFLMTYKSFATQREVLESIFLRFSVSPPQGLTEAEIAEFIEKKQTPIRLRVTNVLKTWIEDYFEDFQKDEDFKLLNGFINTTLKNTLKNASEMLQKLIKKKVAGTATRKMVFSGKAPLPIVSKSLSSSKIKFLDLDPLEVARQFTLMESKIFNQIQHSECIGKAWSTPEVRTVAPNIKELIERANKLTAWIVETILMEENIRVRISIVRHFIAIAEKCRLLNNFNSLMAIIAGLSSAPVNRLKRTWASIPAKVRQSIDSLRVLMDSASNFNKYREALHSSQPPCVPFLGLYLTDLTFIEDGNLAFLKGTNLINFDKRAKVATVIREIKQYQSSQYCLQAVSVIEEYFINKFKNVRPIDTLYDQSLKIEPRETGDDTVIRLLSESGLY